MSLARVRSVALAGVEAVPVEVEVQVRRGTPRFSIIGLADGAIRESRDRVLSALRVSGFHRPEQVLVNLAPAELRKEGSLYDLPIALGILLASGQITSTRCADTLAFGELALDARVNPVRGAIAFCMEHTRSKGRAVILPAANYQEAALLDASSLVAVRTLAQAVHFLTSGEMPEAPAIDSLRDLEQEQGDPLSDVVGQEGAKRALMIAAAGGHNVLMSGPPGCGKSMLAARFAALLPPLFAHERREVALIQSISGLSPVPALRGVAPFRAPHHVVSDIGLIGGGNPPRPGEISLAHRGVLFLDEFPEFRRSALEAMRAPLESGMVVISRARHRVTFPARFQLVAAMNPCPCGRRGMRGSGSQACVCSSGALESYLRKLSAPILDRIDLSIELEPVPLATISLAVRESPSKVCSPRADGRLLVRDARIRQFKRQRKLNSELSMSELLASGMFSDQSRKLAEHAVDALGLSMRGFVRTLRLALTIADLEAGDVAAAVTVTNGNVAEALQYRFREGPAAHGIQAGVIPSGARAGNG